MDDARAGSRSAVDLLARRAATPRMSFGWGRAEIIAAFVNYLALIAISLWLAVEA